MGGMATFAGRWDTVHPLRCASRACRRDGLRESMDSSRKLPTVRAECFVAASEGEASCHHPLGRQAAQLAKT
ncbi:hypothetical protein ES703_29232 [subsurface metagenome]